MTIVRKLVALSLFSALSLFAVGCALTINDIKDMGSDKDIGDLESVLNSEENEQLRAVAASELGKLDEPEAYIILEQALSSSSANVRRAAMEGLLSCADRPSLELTFKMATKDPDPSIRKLAEEKLAISAPDAKAKLLGLLNSTDYRDRALAVRRLGYVRDLEVVKELISLSRWEENSEVRKWIAVSMGKIQNPAAKAALFRLRWQDPDRSVNIEAERALARFAPPVFNVQIAVAPLENNTGSKALNNLGKEFAQVISAGLEREGICHMIERTQIEKALEELKFGMSDMADDDKACKLGKFLTAQQVIYGSIQRDRQEFTVVVQRMDVETLKILQSVTERGYEADLGQLKSLVADQLIRTFKCSN